MNKAGHLQVTTAQLSALVTVIDAGTFTEAALELGLAQSSVSGLIGSLERLLDVRLLDRGRRGAVPTPLGERVAVHARLVLRALEDLQLEASRDQKPEGTLRLIACRTAARFLVTPTLARLRERHPQIQVELRDTAGEHDEIEQVVLNGEAHLGFGRLPMAPALHARELLADEFQLVLPASWRVRTWADLRARPLIVCSADCAPYIAAHWARQGEAFRPSWNLQDPSVILSMVREGLGYTVLSGLVLHPRPEGVRLQPLPTPLWRPLGYVARSEIQHHPLIRAYTQVLCDQAYLRQVTETVTSLVRFPEH
jgi:DNA-binding transcriptional LysR family regulator